MPSSVIRGFDYDAEARALTIRFVSGARYRYDAVPAALVCAFRAADSKGRFFSAQVRERFPTTRLD